MKHLKTFFEKMLDKQGGYEDNGDLKTWNRSSDPIGNSAKKKNLPGEILRFDDDSNDGDIKIPYKTGSKKGVFTKAKIKEPVNRTPINKSN